MVGFTANAQETDNGERRTGGIEEFQTHRA